MRARASKERIIGLVHEAFAGVQPPSSQEFAHCDQCRLWVERFVDGQKSDWRQISDEDIAYESEALTAVKPDGWKFLLPAYLIWHLRNYETADSNTVSHLIYQLTRTEDTDPHIVECYRSLSQRQRYAVAEFLRFVAGQTYDEIMAGDASRALSSYWE